MELPPYRAPVLGNTLKSVWEKIRDFLHRAGTVILFMSVMLWFLQSFDFGLNYIEDSSLSILSGIGGAIAPVFAPLGFGVWQAVVALLTGFIAKEAMVASLSVFHNFSITAEPAVIAAALSGTFVSPLAALSFLVFTLLYVPCVATVAAIRREMNSLKWTAVSVGWQMLCAYLVSFLVYKIGRLIV